MYWQTLKNCYICYLFFLHIFWEVGIKFYKKQNRPTGRIISAGPSAIRSVFQNKAACKRKSRTHTTLKKFGEGWTYSGIYPSVLSMMQTPLYCRHSPLIHSFSIITSCSLFQQYLWEQTTFYNSASYCGLLHYSHHCFAHCRDMLGIAPHVFYTAAQAPISSLADAHKTLVILTY